MKRVLNFSSKLNEFYNGEVPDYVRGAGKNFIVINAGSEWEGFKQHRITPKDVIAYYATQAPNISSGCRTLAGITGDWRPIDNLAKECLEWFKFVNADALRREGLKVGLEAKF
jgi:hypothetical protein